jgi:hypothetical protein
VGNANDKREEERGREIERDEKGRDIERDVREGIWREMRGKGGNEKDEMVGIWERLEGKEIEKD